VVKVATAVWKHLRKALPRLACLLLLVTFAACEVAAEDFPTLSRSLQLELVVPVESAAGAPIPVELKVRNQSSNTVMLKSEILEPFSVLSLLNAAGESDVRIGGKRRSTSMVITLAPGEWKSVWRDFDLTTLYLVDKGAYRLQVIVRDDHGETVLSSEPSALKIGGGRLPPLKRIVQQFRSELSEGWAVSLDDQSVVLDHSPTGRRRDATTLYLRFQPDQPANIPDSARGVTRMIVSDLGHFPMGHCTLIAHPRVRKLWPEYMTDIGRVLRDPSWRDQDLP
jgi:hypothetical protein